MTGSIDRSKVRQVAVQLEALRRAMEAIMNGTTPDHAKWIGYRSFAAAYNKLSTSAAHALGQKVYNSFDVENFMPHTGLVWPLHKQIWETVYTEVVLLTAQLAEFSTGRDAHASEIHDMLHANLRRAIFVPPSSEKDIQDTVESLFIGRGLQRKIDYDRETGRVKFSGREFIPDFIFPPIRMALEVKLIKERSSLSECVEQMSADIAAYLSEYESVLFCVYDMGVIRDVAEFQEGLLKQPGVKVAVVKH